MGGLCPGGVKVQEKCDSISFYEAYALVGNSHTNKWGNRTTAIHKVNEMAEKAAPTREASGALGYPGQEGPELGHASLRETQVRFLEDLRSVPGDSVESIQQGIPKQFPYVLTRGHRLNLGGSWGWGCAKGMPLGGVWAELQEAGAL